LYEIENTTYLGFFDMAYFSMVTIAKSRWKHRETGGLGFLDGVPVLMSGQQCQSTGGKQCQPQQISPAPYCRVLPPDKFNGVMCRVGH